MINIKLSKVIPSVERDYGALQEILGTHSWYPSEHVGEDSYWANYDEGDVLYSNSLPVPVAENVKHFLETVNQESYTSKISGPLTYPNLSEELQIKYQDIMVTTNSQEPSDEEARLVNYLIGFRNLLGECYSYEEDGKNCRSMGISGYVNGEFYGCVYTFENDSEDYLFFQGITKSLSLALSSYFFPDLTPTIKVNSILIPAVEDYASKIQKQRLYSLNLGLDKIRVKPIGIQGRILEKFYGFQKEPNSPPLMCSSIVGFYSEGVGEGYIKYL